MDTNRLLLTSVQDMLKYAVKGPIVVDDQISEGELLYNHKTRAQFITEHPPKISLGESEGAMAPLNVEEVKHCAAVIATAFLNPYKVEWDYERFADSTDVKRSEKYVICAKMGNVTEPTTVVDRHGRIFMWYLPGLLLPCRVDELNRVTMCLKELQAKTLTTSTSAWRTDPKNFSQIENPIFGKGNLSLSVGRFQQAHERLEDKFYGSPHLTKKPVQQWLQLICPVEELLNAVLYIVHPEMYTANCKATHALLEVLNNPSVIWPTVYHGMDVVANRRSKEHMDLGGAVTFYDHLVSFGQGHDAKLRLRDLDAEFAYQSGTCALFSGKALTHEVQQWSGGERMVIAHYANDDILNRVKVARPLLPTQLGWWTRYS